MKIHSISFSNTSTLRGKWTVDLQKPDYKTQPFFLLLNEPKLLENLLLGTIELALFGPKAQLTEDELNALGERAEVSISFRSHDKTYHASWTPGILLEDGLHFVEDESGKVLAQQTTEVTSLIKRLTGVDENRFHSAFKINLDDFTIFFSPTFKFDQETFEKHFQDSTYGQLSPLINEISNQKSALLTASKEVINSIKVLDPSEEEKTNQALLASQQELSSLQEELAKNREASDWLTDLTSLKEEISKLTKQKATLNSEVSRFEVKRVVLEKAKKAESLQPQFLELQRLRELEKENQKQINESKKNLPHLSEKARIAASSLAEAEKHVAACTIAYKAKNELCDRVFSIDEQITSLMLSQENKKGQLTHQSNALKQLNEENSKVKSLLSQLKIAQQQVQRKIDDLHVDPALIHELDEIEKQVNQIEIETQKIEDSSDSQKSLQKNIEKNRALILELTNDLNTLKKEEHACTSEETLKAKNLAKLLGLESVESLQKDLIEQNRKLDDIANINKFNEELLSLAEQVAKEKTQQEKNRHATRLNGMVLSAAEQALKDKSEVVRAYEESYQFLQQVASFEKERNRLENGRPCPLCGAIHHPYSTSTPHNAGVLEKLRRAQQEEQIAQQARNDARQEADDLKAAMDESIATTAQINQTIEKLKSKILSLAPGVELLGLREKKAIAWGQLIKQKAAVLCNKRDDLAERLAKIEATEQALQLAKTNSMTIAEKLAAKKYQVELHENEISADQSAIQDQVRIEKEASLNRESLTRQLERIFMRFGIKASTGTLLKQNFPVLIKKKEQWEALDADLIAIEHQIQEESHAQNLLTENLNNQRKLIDSIEKELSESSETLKRLQKERYDLLANQQLDEVMAQSEAELNKAEKQFDEASHLNKRRKASFEEAQKNITAQEERLAQLVEKILSTSLQFSEDLKANGFNNETIFQASHISDVQREELQRQYDELEQKVNALDQEMIDKKAKHDALVSQDLTKLQKSQLDEQFNLKSSDLARVKVTVSTLRDALARNLSDKLRKQRETAEVHRLEEETLHWKHLVQECLENESKQVCDEAMVLDLLLELTTQRLRDFSYNWRLVYKGGQFYIDSREGSQGTNLTSLYQLEPSQKMAVRLAIALARSEMKSGRTPADFVLFNAEPGATQQQTIDLLSVLHLQGKLIALVAPDKGLFEKMPALTLKEQNLFGSGVQACHSFGFKGNAT